MKYQSAYVWEKNARNVNEDSIAIYDTSLNNRQLVFAIVCDGIGGLEMGENASSFVVHRLKHCVYSFSLIPNITIFKMRKYITREIYRCHQYLRDYYNEHHIRLGTTLSMILIYGHFCYIFNIGDSRVYLGYGKKVFRCRVPSHSDSKGRLLRAVGLGVFEAPYCRFYPLFFRSTFLICSDGFYRHNGDLISNLPADVFELRHKNPSTDTNIEISVSDLLKGLYYHAVNCGECDNCSAVAIWNH